MADLIHRPGPYLQYPAYQRTREMSIEDMLLENRIIFLAGDITEHTASLVIMRLLYLQSIKKDQDINLYINSRGGLVDQTLAVYDTMQFMGCDVATYCIGQAASGAALILMAGTKGKRFILPNARVMLHQPYGGIGGQAEDMRIQAEEILKSKTLLNEIIAKHTGQTVEKVREETERDRFLSAADAKVYGIVDEVLEEIPSDGKKGDKKKK
jgi:ATP-dependent Clp protease protease subunit